MNVEPVTLRTGAVAEIQAALRRPDDPEEPYFFLTHGAGGDLNTPGLVALADAIVFCGHAVVRADLPYRGAGRSTPPAAEKSIAGFIEEFEQVRERFGPDARWVVGGRSYGGRVASMAVAGGLEVAGLLLYSYPLHRPGDPSQIRVDHFPRIAVPSLFLEGTNDPFCKLDLLKAHLGDLGAEATIHVIPGGDHSLKVARANAPDGVARSEKAVVGSLGQVVEDWVTRFVQAP
jgi:predicted alpha/beta-hydrolase family hydrolase